MEFLFLLGCMGGVGMEVLKWYRIREELHKGFPDYAKNWRYWVVTVSMCLVGGGLACVYQASEGVNLNPILAVNIGASAPPILGALSGQVPRIDQGSVN